MKRRLFLQIYAAFLGLTFVWLVTTAIVGKVMWGERDRGWAEHVQGTFAVLADDLPAPDAPPEQQAAALEALAGRTKLGLALWSADRELVAATFDDPEPPRGEAHWVHRGGPGLVGRLPDGRWLEAVAPNEHERRFGHFFGFLGVVGAVMAAGCWPVARRITRRLELLQHGVDRWGEGALDTRVPVLGHDEIAELAARFNTSADRIQALVEGQRRMLASASHELRSPLARVRMALELLADGDPARQRLVDGAERDVVELDELIGDLLLASRLEARPVATEPVDLGAIAAEEAARVGATATGEGVVRGDAKALRRMVRNLLENAVRYGAAPIEVAVQGGHLRVSDRGPGVAESERERIWEPFYRPAGHKESDGGVGLGLALVKQIAERHGGSASCAPREGGGTTFRVDLPS